MNYIAAIMDCYDHTNLFHNCLLHLWNLSSTRLVHTHRNSFVQGSQTCPRRLLRMSLSRAALSF